MSGRLLDRERLIHLEAAVISDTATREEVRDLLRHMWALQSRVAELEEVLRRSTDDAQELAEWRRQAREARTVT